MQPEPHTPPLEDRKLPAEPHKLLLEDRKLGRSSQHEELHKLPPEDHKLVRSWLHVEQHKLPLEDRKPVRKLPDRSVSLLEHSKSRSQERSKLACSIERSAVGTCSRDSHTVVELLVCNIAAGMSMHSRSSSRRHNGRRRRREQLER